MSLKTSEEQFNADEKITAYIKSKKKEARTIGLFIRAKKMKPENQAQLNGIYKRNVRATKELDPYGDNRIIRTMKYLIDNADYKWTLETVLKHIDEDFDSLEGKEPIITLKDGERIYSVERIKQLERDGKIYYSKNRWQENNG